MKINDDPNATEGFFAGDLPEGKINLECKACLTISEHPGVLGESFYCTSCKRELVYRSWWEW